MQMKKNKGYLAVQGRVLALLAVGTGAMAEYNTVTGEWRKDQTPPRLYNQQAWVNNFALQLPLGATFAPQMTAWDENDGDLSGRIKQVGSVNTQQVGSYLAKFEVSDNGLPKGVGYMGWGFRTTTFSLPVTVYDPAVAVPSLIQPLSTLWQEAPVGNGLLKQRPGQSLSRTIRITSTEHPLSGDELEITLFRVQEGLWGGNNRQFSLRLTDKESGEPAYEGSVLLGSGKVLTPTAPIKVRADQDYEFRLTYVSGPSEQGFRANEEGELWLAAEGRQVHEANPYAQVLPDPANKLAFDPGLDSAMKQKLLSSQGVPEALLIGKVPNQQVALSYRIANPALASLQLVQGEIQDRLQLQGLTEGETWLEILADGRLVEQVRLFITSPKAISLSYSYIAFPGERKSHLWDDGDIIMADMSRRLAPYNIRVNWVDHGVLVHEWDKNGNGQANEPDRSEIEAPLNEGWIPNADQVFSNLYVLRGYKNDAKACSYMGSASSIGMGATDGAPRVGYRYACPGNLTVHGQSLTLTHELGHNLGLWHTGDEEPYRASNIMTAGRFEGVFFADQWRTMHHTIEARIAAGDAGVSEVNAEPELPPPATNQPPLANAGGDMRTTGPAELVLDGSASRDPENGALRYQWRQVGGPQASLRDAEQSRARLSLGTVAQDTQLAFELTVTDEQGLAGVDSMVVTHQAPPPNQPPVLAALAPASVQAGKQVSITASATDPDGDALSYQWTVPAGLSASGQNSKTLVVTGPNVASDTLYDLTLMVTDGALDASAGTRLTVTPLSSGGGCETNDPDAAYWPGWSAGTVYNTNDKVSHKQLVWQAKYWTQGNEPSQSADQWKLVSQVQLGWHAAVAYSAGELANHKGRKWQARYWTKGNEPGTADVWADQGVATCH